MSSFFVVPAPGHYGTHATVLSSHATLEVARRKVGKSTGYVIRKGSKAKGQEWLPVYEETYPVAE